MFVRGADGTDFTRRVPTAQDITPWGTTSDQGCYLGTVATDPSATGIVYVGGNQNLWQSRDGGGNWRIIGTLGGVAITSVAPTNGNNVVAAVGQKVWVSTNALAASRRHIRRHHADPAEPQRRCGRLSIPTIPR